jgi:hypothetical protein
MNDHVELSDLEGDDRATAPALFAAFQTVKLDRPSPARSTAEDVHTAALLARAFDGIHLNRPAPGDHSTPAAAPATRPARIVALPPRPATRRRAPVWLAGAAAAVLALALTVTLAPGGSTAAWAAEPTTPTSGDRAAAATACGAPLARGLGDLEWSGGATADGALASAPGAGPTVPQSLPPLAVLDIRGDGALAIYQNPTWQVTCLLAREGDLWVDQGISVGPGPGASTPGVVFGSRTSWIGGDSVAYLGGSVPPGTTKVTFDLSDGTTVQASLMGTTFAAWFPGERNYVPASLVTYDANNSPHR